MAHDDIPLFTGNSANVGEIINRLINKINSLVSVTKTEILIEAPALDVDAPTATDATLAFSDITTNDVSITQHGFAPKSPGSATVFLDGTGAYSTPPAGSGDVVGPAGATDNHLAVFDGVTGKLIKDGGAIPSSGATSIGTLTDAKTDYTNTSVYLGQGAGSAHTSGTNNTAVGENALNADSGGAGNTAIGASALLIENGATNTTALGSRAGIALTTGRRNTLVGANTGQSLTTGTTNTVVGYNAAFSLSTGLNNIIVGQGGNTLTTGNSNVIIGTSADVQDGSSTNRIAIGAGTLVTADNTAELGNASITDVYLGGGGGAAIVHAVGTALTGITTAIVAASTNKKYVTDAQLAVIAVTSGTNTGDQTNITGNAGTATALQNPRTINGVSFDGTANITIASGATSIAGLSDAKATTFTLFLGAGVGGSSTSGANTGLGQLSLQNLNFGVDGNTGIGTRSLNALTSGGHNTAVGNQAGFILSSGSNNVLMGEATGSDLTSGFSNVAVGTSSGQGNITGHDNVSVGQGAGGTGTAAINQIAIGSNAVAPADNAGQVGNSSFTNLKIGTTLGSIQTGDTTNTSSAPWKLGQMVTALTTADTTQYLEIMVNGVLRKLVVAT